MRSKRKKTQQSVPENGGRSVDSDGSCLDAANRSSSLHPPRRSWEFPRLLPMRTAWFHNIRVRTMQIRHLLSASILTSFVAAEECPLSFPADPLTFDLSGLSSVSFVGTKPKITRVNGDPQLKVFAYSMDSEPTMEVLDGKLVVTAGSCSLPSSARRRWAAFGGALLAGWSMDSYAFGLALALIPTVLAEDMVTCDNVMEVEIHGPPVSRGQYYMEEDIRWPDFDGSDGSLHFTANPTWGDDVEAIRRFRETESGGVYNYRNKVLMGMSQTRVLNDPPSVTEKDDVMFDVPLDVVRPTTDEEVMMLSVLEMQGLLRTGQLTSVELTNIAFGMLEKYDPEFNMLEVELKDLALEVAGKADEMFVNGTYTSPIQGIPFAVKDTYDVKGYATAYGSWEFMDNIVESESPLVTYAVNAGAVPLFKSSVPQLTWGYANYKGTVYSCLNGGFAAGAGGSGGSSIGSGAAVCLGVVPVAICEQTGSSCQAPAIASGISTVIPALGTFSRENNGLYSMESDRPGLLCRDILSCAVFYNYMRGTSPGDPQSRDVPFGDPSKEDISNYTIGFSDNSDTEGWPEAWDTPFMGERGNVVEALEALGATVVTKDSLAEFMEPTQLLKDYEMSGVGSKWFAWFDWYWLNVEGFFEDIFKYGGKEGALAYGPVLEGQNFNFDNGFHREHIGASAYAYLDDLWLFGYVSEMAMYPMLQTLPDVVVHFAQSELNGAHNLGMIKRAGINTVHIPEFYWNTTDETFVDWAGSRPIDYYSGTTVSAAMITCESKKYEPIKAFAVCYQLQQALVPGGKLISPYIQTIHEALKSGEHDLDCPYNWTNANPNYLDDYPDSVRDLVMSKMVNRGKIPTCGADTAGGCTGGTCSDIRFKHSVKQLGVSRQGIPFYSFQYKEQVPDVNTKETFRGVIAQDLISLAPQALCRSPTDGFFRVDYSKLDVEFSVIT